MTAIARGATAAYADDTIVSVDAWTCSFDLPTPLVLRDLVITKREYVVVRIETAGGVSGVAYSLTRGAPIAAVIRQLLLPELIGFDALAIPGFHERISASLRLLGAEGIVQRAISLIDIGLWDIKARVAKLPLWRLLGGVRSSAPVLLVDSYAREGTTPQDMLENLRLRASQGYSAMKLHALPRHNDTAKLLSDARDMLGAEIALVVDAAMEFEDPRDALAAARLWTPARPDWIEDPFRGEQAQWMRFVRDRSDVPIGAGDELASVTAMRDLVDAVDVIRLDATTHLGLTGVAALASVAEASGRRVSTHVYPEIHQHCAFAWGSFDHVEAFAPMTPFDAAEAFILPSTQIRAVDGYVHAPDRLGLGLEFDWDAVKHAAV